MTVVSLHRETTIMEELRNSSLELIHHTDVIAAIKRLIIAYEILDLNIRIEKEYKPFEGRPPWDLAAFKDLDMIRFELMTKFSSDFNPAILIPRYYQRMGGLFNIMNLRFR